MWAVLKRDIPVWIVILMVGGHAFFNLNRWKNYESDLCFQFTTDQAIYYSYLPAFFINNDPFFKLTAQPCAFYDSFSENKLSPKYTFGMAIMYSPFFIAAITVDPMEDELSKFGLTKTFSRFIRIGNVLYFLLGMFFLLKTLGRYFNGFIVVLSGCLVYFATNLPIYTIVEGEMPHVHLFALFSIIIYCSHRYWETKTKKHLFILSLAVGMATLIRPSEVIFALIPIFWSVSNLQEFRARMKYFWENKLMIVIAIAISIVPIMLQLVYWKMHLGSFFLDTFSDERFFFDDPKIWDFLFGFRKGWFVYTPIMFFATLGFVLLPRYMKESKYIFPLLILVAVFIFSSWWCWWYGGSFGSRVMVQYYSIMIFPLAALLTYIIQNRFLLVLFGFMMVLFVYVNMNLSIKYIGRILHWDSMTFESFRYVILKDEYSDNDIKIWSSLLETPDYEGAKNGENR